MYCYCVFENHTTASRVKKAVSNDLYRVFLVQAPKAISPSCSYALKFDIEKLSEIKSIVEKNSFRIRGLFKETDTSEGAKEYHPIR